MVSVRAAEASIFTRSLGIAHWSFARSAARFQLRADKGGIKIGAQADIAFVDLNAEWEIRREDLLQRHPISPYIGRKVRGKVVRTMIFSRTVYLDGKIIGKHAAQLLKHQPLI